MDPQRLDAVEETTEALANDLLDLCVALPHRDGDEIAPWFAERLESASIPVHPGPTHPDLRWVVARDWSADGPAAPRTRAEAVASLEALLGELASVEDVRIKPKSALPRAAVPAGCDAALDGQFKMYVIGRDHDGHLEWLRGTGTLGAVRSGGRFRLDRLVFDKLASQVGTRPLFSEVTAPAGVAEADPTFAERGETGLLAHGAAVADVNGDGLIDVFATGLNGNRLYLNQGDGTFKDVAASAHVATLESPGVGPLFIDYDNDGDEDLFITTLGRQVLLENRFVPDGRLVFRDVSSRMHVDVDAPAFSATATDLNGDGRADIYVACYNRYGQVVPDHWDGAQNGFANLLFVSQPDGTFREEAAARGVADSRWSYAATFADVDGDGAVDLLVGNDFGPGAALFRNDGTGHFTDVTASAGLAKPGYSMGLSVGDYDDDGVLDIHVTNMTSNAGARVVGRFAPGVVPDEKRIRTLFAGNSLFHGLGGGRFEDVTAKAGPFPGNWAWGGGFIDCDNDGHEDLYTPNGFLSGKNLHDT